MKIAIAFFIICTTLSIQSQTLEIPLDSISTLDDESIQIEILTDEPREQLVLPTNIQPHKYLTLFYTFDSENDEVISIAVVQNDSSDILYIDYNNDEDLTNDGEPVKFNLNDNEFMIEIINNNDLNQVTKQAIYRTPPLNNSEEFFEANGNLKKHIANLFGTSTGKFDFIGEKRTYYFDDRVSLRRGKILLDTLSIAIGLFDYNNNGLFNDSSDVLIIDMNQDGKLGYLQDEDIFKFNDVVNLSEKNYLIKEIDKYGRKIVFTETDKRATKYFSIWNREINYESKTYELNPKFWEYTFTDLDENKINVKKYKGRYLLLNFWGEWCAPCRIEIPDLIKVSKKYSDDLVILGFLKTNDLAKAKEYISSQNIDWAQIELPEVIETQFKVRSYPTNILIMPNGSTFFREGLVKENYFDVIIK